MKHLQMILFIFLFQMGAAAQLVVKVIDGDTYKIMLGEQVQHVRLQNVDAPELKQFFGETSKNAVHSLIEGHAVAVQVTGIDLYGRLIASIKIEEMRLDSLLVARGLAWVYKNYCNEKILFSCEALARSEAVGLWKCKRNIPP